MSFKQFMQPRQRNQFQVIGEFLYVEACNDKVLLQTERGEYRLQQGAQIIDDKLSGLVTIENLGEAANVEILYGFGRYVPPLDGQSVTVSQMPAVQVSELPAMQLSENQQVAISALPEVVLAANQQLAISQLPKVQLETGQALRIYATNPVLTKPVGGASVETSLLTIASGQAVLAANSLRCHVLLKASLTNVGVVTIGNGFTLSAGEKQQIDSFGGLSFSGTDNDTIEIIEVIR